MKSGQTNVKNVAVLLSQLARELGQLVKGESVRVTIDAVVGVPDQKAAQDRGDHKREPMVNGTHIWGTGGCGY